MKKSIFTIVIAALLLSSCSSYTASGAIVGGEFGHVIGSAIGGITGGWRGHDVGSLIGTVGGAMAGAAIGSAVEKADQDRYRQATTTHHGHGVENNRCVPNTGAHGQLAAQQALPSLVIRNAAIYDSDHNGVLTRGEECTVVFEVMNNTSSTIYDVYPLVEDVTGNRHVQVSPTLRVESIAPHSGIRYTATILADRKLKDGEILVRVGVSVGQKVIETQTQEFSVPTRKHS